MGLEAYFDNFLKRQVETVKIVGDVASGDFAPGFGEARQKLQLRRYPVVGVDRIRQNFKPMPRQVESWRRM